MANVSATVRSDEEFADAVAPCPAELVRERLKGTNINPATLLATDFLNPFNEVEMVLDLLPSCPEYFEEIASWRPRNYRDHFAHSSLRHGKLALEAYDYVSAEVRDMFDDVVDRLNRTTERAIATVRKALATADSCLIATSCAGAAGELRALIGEAGGVINGTALRKVKPNGSA